MNLLEGLENIGSDLLDFFQTFVDMIVNAISAMQTFYELLDEFDTRVVAMVDECGTNEFTGLPVKEAIGTFRYVVGDVIFYLIYLVVLFGCLWTIFKLVILIYAKVKEFTSQLSGGITSKAQFSTLLSKVFRL